MNRQILGVVLSFVAIGFLRVAQASDVLFLDLNNSKEEIKACYEGMKAADPNANLWVVNKEQLLATPGLTIDIYRDVLAVDLDWALASLRLRHGTTTGTKTGTVTITTAGGVRRQFDAVAPGHGDVIDRYLNDLRAAGGGAGSQIAKIEIADRGGSEEFKPEWKMNIRDIDRYVAGLEAAGVQIDTVGLSGHDGNSTYFGTQGTVSAEELAWTFDQARHPGMSDNIKMLFQWGCYNGNVNACQQVWGKNVLRNVSAQFGFTVGAPLNTVRQNFVLLKDVCFKRKEMQEAQGAASLNRILDGLNGLTGFHVGLCKEEALCSNDPDYGDGGDCYHDWAEMYARCKDLDPGHEQLAMYNRYLRAEEERYANPPEGAENNPVREYYNRVNRWAHCMRTSENPNGVEMPSPGQMIRLILFNDVKANLLNFHLPQLREYNTKLDALGLGAYKLDNLSGMSRQEIVKRTQAGVVLIERMMQAGQTPVNGVSTAAAWSMAVQFDRVLRILQPRCIPDTWLHNGMGSGYSDCIASYGKAPQWPPPTP